MDGYREKQRPRVGVGVVVVKEGKVLLGKRKGAHGAGTWSIAGGHLEYGESLEKCATRELAEETGLKALSIQLGPWTNDVIDEDRHYISLFVFVDQFEGEPQLLEPEKCEGWEWFDWNNLPSPIFLTVRSLIHKMGIDRLKRISSKSQEGILDDRLNSLLTQLLSSYQEREWDEFHSPKNLVMDLASEVGELIDPFRWLTGEQSNHLNEKVLTEVRDEIGDVFNTLIYLCHKLGINPIDAANEKLEKMKKKYPVELCRGKIDKYTAYENNSIFP